MGKRGNNEGSVYFDGSVGRYRAAVSLPNGRRKTVSGRTRAECASKLTQLQGRLSAGLPIESSDQLSTFLDWWITSLEARAATETRSVNTVDNARWAVEKWIKPYVGGHRLRDLEPEHVEMLLAAMAAAGKSRRTVARVKSYLGQALAAAERRGKVSRNVARLAEMPVTKPPVERQSLDHDQARTILEAASGHRLEALFVCALMLGLRPGELTGLRWADVDLEGGTLQVAASMKRERGQLRLGNPKTARSRRTLRLPAPVLEALHVHDLRQALEHKEAGAAWIGSDLVFTTEVGTGLDPSNLRRLTRALTKRAGVPDVSPNELGRHSAASLLYDAGVSLEEIADLLGHTSTRMLEQHYRHRVRASMSAHVAPMEAIFGPH